MKAFVYKAALYCEDCGQEVVDRLRGEWRKQAEAKTQEIATDLETKYAIDPDKWPRFFNALERGIYRSLAVDASDEGSYDSDDFPKGPYPEGGGEADTPQHCDSCHEFLENPLTSDGMAYVRENQRGEWDSFYGIEREIEPDIE